ncbi:MAG: PIG-L family deacetylase [Synechococcales cyanobacterium C42_A2020_086]|nr:PIG-L family deacetylase [Synechococcales cyanobacterium C42_A2020_086]
MSWRTPICQLYRFGMQHLSQPYAETNLSKPTMVFSPHQDDETLGCGGTLIRKKQAGAVVKIVFMTDGCKSHAHLIPEADLRAIRAQEAIAAAQVLGLAPEDVIALNFTDGALQESQAEAIQVVRSLLEIHRPEEIFLPCREEPPADHAVTYWIVQAALRQTSLQPTLYEYPIWVWDQYPWTTGILGPQGKLAKLKITLSRGLGLPLLMQFRAAVPIQSVRDQKQTALAQHRSQMQRLIPSDSWTTLGDLSHGEFLQCFLQNYEFFRVSRSAAPAHPV